MIETSGHLPECPWADGYAFLCICDRLRACEKRVTDEIWGAIHEGSQYKSGFEGGLDAARDAVWRSIGPGSDTFFISVFDRAFAAIDALRGES